MRAVDQILILLHHLIKCSLGWGHMPKLRQFYDVKISAVYHNCVSIHISASISDANLKYPLATYVQAMVTTDAHVNAR